MARSCTFINSARATREPLSTSSRLAKLPAQRIGAGYADGAFALCKTQRSLLSTQLLALVDDPALDLQHDIRVG
jgi:hypothetical protein